MSGEPRDEIVQHLPAMRAFALSLTRNSALADDMVQDSLVKAWTKIHTFEPGTNMRAWTFIILRNHYLSQMRRSRFRGDWDDLTADRILAAPAGQDKHVELSDMQRALLQLPQPQREALILVGAGGFAYEEAAEICGVAVGTIKSRVARGRAALEQILENGDLPSRRTQETTDSAVLDEIMDDVDRLSRGGEGRGTGD